MAKILITGGAGFLGQYLVEKAAQAGHDIRVVDLRPSPRPRIALERYCASIAYGVDITRPETLRGRFAGVDAVFHLAGLVSFWRKHAELLHAVNVVGTRTVAEAALAEGAGRLVHVSSVAAVGYGNGPDDLLGEDAAFDWEGVPHKHYMRSKRASEDEVRAAGERGLPAVIVNPGLLWGPADLTNSAPLLRAMRRGKVPACPPGGTNIVDVRDVARGLLAAAEKGRPGERYILGGENVSFRHAYDEMADALGVPAPKRVLPRAARIPAYYAVLAHELLRRSPPQLTSDHVESSFLHRYFSSAKAQRELGWLAEIAFPQTVRDSVAWLRANDHLPPSDA